MPQSVIEVGFRPIWDNPRMSGNTFGTLFAVTNFGESPGPAIGCVIDGCPPGMALSDASAKAHCG